MPVYDFKCQCGTVSTRFLRLAEYDTPQNCDCGKLMMRQVSAPAVLGDYPGYACPISGQWVEGKRAHAANLAKHGCRVLESGEREQLIRRKRSEELALDKAVDATVEGFIEALPARKKELLASELSSGADVNVARI